jgi:hypothetical protein
MSSVAAAASSGCGYSHSILQRIFCHSEAVAEKKNMKTSGFVWTLGHLSLWLRDKWILTICIALAAAALAFLPRFAVDDQGKMFEWALFLVTALGIAAAVAAALDKFADKHSKKLDALEAIGEQTAGGRAVSAIVVLMDEIHQGAFVGTAMRRDRWKTLRASLAAAAAAVPTAENVRATYYPLSKDNNGLRELKDPRSRGRGNRQDQADSEFFEAMDPDHPIWKIMDVRDTACEIVSEPDKNSGVDWDKKPYKTFISVPVKADKVQFGLLSVNAPVVGDLTELDRLSLIALARTMAAILAFERGPVAMREERDTLGARARDGYSENDYERETP